MNDIRSDTKLIHMLLSRLERISADSYWAHRASGVRGALLRALEKIEDAKPVSSSEMKRLLELGFSILGSASAEKYK